MLALGPVLIVTVMVLVSCETYWALKHLVPLFAEVGSLRFGLHAGFIVFLAVNGMFNYFCCVLTDPGIHTSKTYADLVYAASQDGALADTDWTSYADLHGLSKRRSTKTGRVVRNAGSWIDRGPYEWGYCRYTRGPKAPRSHFDHVTKKLVLNMDHYCPWMFNVVGYGNYRYFVLFLVWVTIACLYGIAITLVPFLAMVRKQQGMTTPKAAKQAVMFTFVLALSVGIAVAILGAWHIFLVLTAQTTIEFYGNHTLRQRAKHRGHAFRNPYDRGLRRNWQHVFGTRPWLLALLPSRRPPPGPPWPDPTKKDTSDHHPPTTSAGPNLV